MINLFIDSNIWLSLYHFTPNDLTQFSKLKDYLGTSIKLYITQQVRDEILRNRESKLKDTFKKFAIDKIQYPAFCKEYDEYNDFKKDYESISIRFNKWKEKIDHDVRHHSLPADRTIGMFFDPVELIPCEIYFDRAFARYKTGNPPGKENKYGDAINWECLLDIVPQNEDLHFISADKDYQSELSDNVFNPFLSDEWARKKDSHIIFYQDLPAFLDKNKIDINLTLDKEKMDLIEQLRQSSTFSFTHGTVDRLSKYSNWTDTQIDMLCNIAEENSQVGRILTDPDISTFYLSLLKGIDIMMLPENSVKRIYQRLIGQIIDEQRSTCNE